MLKLLIAFLLLSLSLSTNQNIDTTYQAKGINEQNNIDSLSEYTNRQNTICRMATNVVHKAKELTMNLNNDSDKAKALFNFVKDKINNVSYDNSLRGASKTLSLWGGNSSDKTNLLVAMCRAVNIPVRYAYGKCKFKDGTESVHVWAQILIDNCWCVADTSSKDNRIGTITNWDYKHYKLTAQTSLLSF